MKKYDKECMQFFLKISAPVLNQVIRPFTAKWHKFSLEGYLEEQEYRDKFREELEGLQTELRKYMGILAEMAGIEDLTDLERVDLN